MGSVTGLPQILSEMSATDRRVAEVASKAIEDQAAKILKQAQARCPVSSGKLKASAYSTPAEARDGAIVAEVGYGVDYAQSVHERQEAELDSGESKWLEKSAVDRAAVIQRELANEIRKAIRGGK